MRYELIKLLSALLEEGYIISFRVTKSKIYAEKASKAKAKGKPAKKRK